MTDETRDATESKIDKFTWSFDVANASKRELELQHNAFKDRIDRIVNHERAIVKGIPILQHLLQLTSDPADLKMLAKACDRLADIMPEYEAVTKRLDLVTESIKNPEWVASVFADFSEDVETFTNEL